MLHIWQYVFSYLPTFLCCIPEQIWVTGFSMVLRMIIMIFINLSSYTHTHIPTPHPTHQINKLVKSLTNKGAIWIHDHYQFKHSTESFDSYLVIRLPPEPCWWQRLPFQAVPWGKPFGCNVTLDLQGLELSRIFACFCSQLEFDK